MNYLYAAILAILYTVGSIAIGYHFGEQHVVVKDDAAVIKQNEAQDTKRITDQATVAQEATTYETATDPSLTPISAPSVSLCHYTPASASLPSANATGPRVDARPALRTESRQDNGPDVGKPVAQEGHNADAQVTGLIDYIKHVCLVEK